MQQKNVPEKTSYCEEEAISRIKRDPVTVDSRVALLLASGKVPFEFSLVPNDKTLNAKLIETCGISSLLHQNRTSKLESDNISLKYPKQLCSEKYSLIYRLQCISSFS